MINGMSLHPYIGRQISIKRMISSKWEMRIRFHVAATMVCAIGLQSDVVECLTNEEIKTMALFAFSCNFSPGSPDEPLLICQEVIEEGSQHS